MFGRRSSELQWLKKFGQNTNIWKDKIRILTIKQTGLEFHCLEGYDKDSNVWKDKITIPMLIEIGPEFHNFEG